MPWASQRTRSGPGLSCSHAASSVGSSRNASNPGTYGKGACPIVAARATTWRAGKVRTTTAATGWSPVYATWAPAIRRSGGRGSAVSTVAASSCWRAIASSTERSQRWVRAIRVLLLDGRRPPRGLLLTERALGGEHLLLGAPRPAPFLAPDARPLARGRLRHPALPRLELLEEEPAREEAVEGLGALALAADDEAGRPVAKHDAGRHLVDVLPAAPARADELLLEVLLAHAEPAHRLLECARLLRRDGKHYRLSKPGTPAPRRPCPAANRAAPARPTPKVAPPRRRSSASPSSSGRPKPRIAASRSASIVSCGKPAISSAHSRAVGTARSAGTTAFTRPKPRASRAPTARPRRIISRARPSPTTRGSRCVPPSTSGTPQRRSKQPNTALSPATLRSHQSASSSRLRRSSR